MAAEVQSSCKPSCDSLDEGDRADRWPLSHRPKRKKLERREGWKDEEKEGEVPDGVPELSNLAAVGEEGAVCLQGKTGNDTPNEPIIFRAVNTQGGGDGPTILE